MVPVPEKDQKLPVDVPPERRVLLCQRSGCSSGSSLAALGFCRHRRIFSRGPDDQGAEDAVDGREARVGVVPEEAGPVDDSELDLLPVAAGLALQRALVDKGDAVVLKFFFFFLKLLGRG